MNRERYFKSNLRSIIARFVDSDTQYWMPDDEASWELDGDTKSYLHAFAHSDHPNGFALMDSDWLIDTFHKLAKDRDIERSNTFQKSVFILTFADQFEKDRYIDWLTSQDLRDNPSLIYVPEALAYPFMWTEPSPIHDGVNIDKAEENIEKVAKWLIDQKEHAYIRQDSPDPEYSSDRMHQFRDPDSAGTAREEGLALFFSRFLTGKAQENKELALEAALAHPCMITDPRQLTELAAHSKELKDRVANELIGAIIDQESPWANSSYLAKSKLFNKLLSDTRLIQNFTNDQQEALFVKMTALHSNHHNGEVSGEYVAKEIANMIHHAPATPILSKMIVNELLLTKDTFADRWDFDYISDCSGNENEVNNREIFKHYLLAPNEFKGYLDLALNLRSESPHITRCSYLFDAVSFIAATDGAAPILMDTINESDTLSLPELIGRFRAKGPVAGFGQLANNISLAAINDIDNASSHLLDNVEKIDKDSKPKQENTETLEFDFSSLEAEGLGR